MSALFPAFFHVLGGILGGCDEEEVGLFPQVGKQACTTLDQAHGLGDVFGVGLHAMLAQLGDE